jgi:peptidoglycan/xylan/chitin deacetylase (PgdA/CDA1 family)
VGAAGGGSRDLLTELGRLAAGSLRSGRCVSSVAARCRSPPCSSGAGSGRACPCRRSSAGRRPATAKRCRRRRRTPETASIAPSGPPATFDPKAAEPLAFPRLNPRASVAAAWQIAQGPAYEESDKRRLVTLTFDDGPFLETTPKILKALAKHHVHASFFVLGQYLDGTDVRAQVTRDLVRGMAADGHAIGNHTHDHQLLTSLSHKDALAQIDDGAASIERVLGKKPTLFRPPYGQLDSFTEEAVASRGTELVLWSVETQDMKRDDTDAMVDSLERQIDHAGGGIVLLHDIRWSTVAALPRLLDWLKARKYDPARPKRIGYEIVDLATYFRATAARPPLPHAERVRLPASALPSGV